MNTRGALSYYREIVKLAKGLKPEPPELKKAKTESRPSRRQSEGKALRLDSLQHGHDPAPELDASLILESIRIADDLDCRLGGCYAPSHCVC